MSHDTMVPLIEALDRKACEALLTRHNVGRLAFTFRDRVNIEPISYVFYDGAIYGRTQHGEKVQVLAHHPWVAFEIDEVTSMVEWQSVVVHGRIEFPDPDGVEVERAAFDKGLFALRSLYPAVFTDEDLMPERDLVFCVHILDINGRRSSLVSKGQ